MLAVKIEVVLPVHRSANPDLNEPPPVDDSFLDRPAERRAVKVLAAEILVPRVDMRVELHERERPVPFRERPQHRQRDRMVAADYDRTGAAIGDRPNARFDGVVALLDADRRRVDVSKIGDVQTVEWRHFLKIAVLPDQGRLIPNLARAVPRSRTI